MESKILTKQQKYWLDILKNNGEKGYEIIVKSDIRVINNLEKKGLVTTFANDLNQLFAKCI